MNTHLDLHRHIQILHDLANGLGGIMVLASYGDGIPPIVRHFKVGDIEGMTKTAIALSQQINRNIYMPLALMRPDLPSHAKGTEKDIIAVLGNVVDFDNGTGINYRERIPLQPSFVLETSPGNAQCFFLYRRPLLITNDEGRYQAKALATKLTQSCVGADRCGADLSHIWRIPNLPNWPNSKKLNAGRDPEPFKVQIRKPFNNDFVTPESFFSLSPAEKEQEELQHENAQLEYTRTITLEELFDRGEHSLMLTIESTIPPGNRSETVASVVWKLLNLGYGTGDIINLIYDHPNGIGERYNGNRKRIEDDVLRLAAKKSVPDEDNHLKEELPYSLQSFDFVDESTIEKRPWVLGHHLLKGKVTVLIAPPGVGKSTASLTWALSIATGKTLFNLPVHESGAVAVINNEDDMSEMNRRIIALMKAHKITHKELGDRLFLQSGEKQEFIIAKRDPRIKTLYPHHKDDLISFCRENDIKALFVDPFLETHEADENDNRQINEVSRMYREIAQKANCAVCLIHHTRKQPGQSSAGHAGNMDSGRGASSLIGVARIVCTLYDMSEKDGREYAIPESDRHLYVRLDDAKANLSLKSNSALWYRRETVSLANGESVGVLKVAHDIEHKKNIIMNTQSLFAISKVKSHDAFKILRENGRIGRGQFVKAMIESGLYLGTKTDTRSTLEERTEKHLLGVGITEGHTRLYMEKISKHYIVYLETKDNDSEVTELPVPVLAGKLTGAFENKGLSS